MADRMPSSLDQFPQVDEQQSDIDEYARELLRKLNMTYGDVRDNNLIAKQRQKQQHDKPRLRESIKVGDRVYLDLITGSKLSYKNEGPFKVTHVKGLVCDIQHLDNKCDVRRVNVSQLRHTSVRTNTTGESSSIDSRQDQGVHGDTNIKPAQSPAPPTSKIVQHKRKPREPTLIKDLTCISDSLSESNFSSNKKLVLQLLGKGSPFITSSTLENAYDKQIKSIDNAEELRTFILEVTRDNGVPRLWKMGGGM